jgi:hypothetical protein
MVFSVNFYGIKRCFRQILKFSLSAQICYFKLSPNCHFTYHHVKHSSLNTLVTDLRSSVESAKIAVLTRMAD